MPLFSIILPTNKTLDEIERSVTSCLASSFYDFEVLIGAQTVIKWNDISSFYYKLLQDSRVRIVDTSTAMNISANLNILLTKSNGCFAVRHDDDDFMHPLRLWSLHKNLEMLDSALIVGQSYKTYSNSGLKTISARIDPCLRDHENREKLLSGPCFAHPAITLNMKKIKFLYDESFTYAQDYKLYIDNFDVGDFLGLPTMATYYNLPDKSLKYYKNKRIQQLGFHDACMTKLWALLLESEQFEIHAASGFRKCFITHEDDELMHVTQDYGQQQDYYWATYCKVLKCLRGKFNE